MIQGISESAQTVSFPEMSRQQQALARIILKDPAVESLSSFIGIDGTNTTMNSGRILINLKPLEQRDLSASDVIRRLQPELAQVAGITLFMQPVQDLSVEDRVSRTQFQYTLEDPNLEELNTYAPKMLERLQREPELRDVASDQQVLGSAGAAGLRPRHRIAARHHAVGDRPDALRRLWPAPGLDHLHAVEPVSRGSRGKAVVPATIRRTCEICSFALAWVHGRHRRGQRRRSGDPGLRTVERVGRHR